MGAQRALAGDGGGDELREQLLGGLEAGERVEKVQEGHARGEDQLAADQKLDRVLQGNVTIQLPNLLHFRRVYSLLLKEELERDEGLHVERAVDLLRLIPVWLLFDLRQQLVDFPVCEVVLVPGKVAGLRVTPNLLELVHVKQS